MEPSVLADPDPIVGFEIAAASENSPDYVEQTPQKLRLNPTLVENLLLSYIEGFVSEKHKIEEGFVQTLGKYAIETAYKKIYCAKNNLPIVVFQITSDSKKDDESRNLPFINDVILTFLSNNPEENMTLLMPMAQCRSQLGKNKKHYVLVEITLHGVNKEIVIHNSQSKSSTFAYFNCLKDLKGFKFTKHHTYHQQKDNFSCGLFVYRYIQSILELGSIAQLKDIRASLAAPCLSLDGIINDNLSRVINLQQRKIAASENLPWERKNLEKYLASENLDQDIDFPNRNDSSLKAGVLPAADSPRTLFFARDLNKQSLEPAPELAEQKMSNSR